MTGNIINRILENQHSTPTPNTFATIIHHSDRTVDFVKDVSSDGKKVILQRCITSADGSKGPLEMGHQQWIHEKTCHEIELKYYRGKWCEMITNFVFINPDMTARRLSQENPNIFNELYDGGDSVYITKEISGLTKRKTQYKPVNILFGVSDYYYCWEI